MNTRKLSTFLILALLSTSYVLAQDITREEYILKYKDIAIKKMRSHGIPASITLAQGCLESGNGNSKLALVGKNHFGIKCHEWEGATIKIDDDIKNECFRKYKRVEESYNDHGDFLRYRERYTFLFDLEITDYKGWAYGLKKAGYATNPKYSQLLIQIIEENNLDQYDKGKRILKNKNPTPPSPSDINSLEEYQASYNSTLYKLSLSRQIFATNKIPYIVAKKGDTYKSIAQESKLFLKEVLEYNDLQKERSIAPGNKVYLQKKRAKAPKHNKIHIAKQGETYYKIAQEYGIRLVKLYKYNELKYNQTRPTPGDQVFLRNYKQNYW